MGSIDNIDKIKQVCTLILKRDYNITPTEKHYEHLLELNQLYNDNNKVSEEFISYVRKNSSNTLPFMNEFSKCRETIMTQMQELKLAKKEMYEEKERIQEEIDRNTTELNETIQKFAQEQKMFLEDKRVFNVEKGRLKIQMEKQNEIMHFLKEIRSVSMDHMKSRKMGKNMKQDWFYLNTQNRDNIEKNDVFTMQLERPFFNLMELELCSVRTYPSITVDKDLNCIVDGNSVVIEQGIYTRKQFLDMLCAQHDMSFIFTHEEIEIPSNTIIYIEKQNDKYKIHWLAEQNDNFFHVYMTRPKYPDNCLGLVADGVCYRHAVRFNSLKEIHELKLKVHPPLKNMDFKCVFRVIEKTKA